MLKREAICSYLDIEGTLFEVGDGFTRFAFRKKPALYTRRYLDEKDARTDVVGYENEIAYAFDGIAENPACAALMQITDGAGLHADVCVDVVTVFAHRTAANGMPFATRQRYAVCPDVAAEGADTLTYTGTLRACAPMAEGTFDVGTQAFVED